MLCDRYVGAGRARPPDPCTAPDSGTATSAAASATSGTATCAARDRRSRPARHLHELGTGPTPRVGAHPGRHRGRSTLFGILAVIRPPAWWRPGVTGR